MDLTEYLEKQLYLPLLVATGSDDGTVCVHDVKTGTLVFQTPDLKSMIHNIAIAPNDQLAVCAQDGYVRMYCMYSGKELRKWNVTGVPGSAIVVKNVIIVMDHSKYIKMIDLKSGKITSINELPYRYVDWTIRIPNTSFILISDDEKTYIYDYELGAFVDTKWILKDNVESSTITKGCDVVSNCYATFYIDYEKQIVSAVHVDDYDNANTKLDWSKWHQDCHTPQYETYSKGFGLIENRRHALVVSDLEIEEQWIHTHRITTPHTKGVMTICYKPTSKEDLSILNNYMSGLLIQHLPRELVEMVAKYCA